MKVKTPILGIIISIIFAGLFTFFSNSKLLFKKQNPTISYQVYLEGKSLGLIKSDTELYDYINKEQQFIKDKYNVSNVYVPNNIKVVKDITYNNNLVNVSTIYNNINQKSPFTIKGYVVVIDKTNSGDYVEKESFENSSTANVSNSNENKSDTKETSEKKKEIITINILDKEMFERAVKKTIFSFVTEEEYDSFINKTQKSIIDTGEIIEDLYIEDLVTIKESYIPVNERIYTSEEELTQYLLFGSNNSMSNYTVQKGDTLENVANANKMNINELLIANANLGSQNALLYDGQKLVVGVMDPIFTTVEEKHVVSDQTIAYKTETIYDNSQLVGYQRVQTAGSNGITRVTQKIKYVNGDIINALISSSEEIKPVVNEVIVKGGKRPVIISAGNWAWPTNVPYIISSQYGWRWGKLHAGIDISGTGHGSPLYAAKSGIVTEVNYNSASGYYVVINHQNGYFTRYAHMASLSRYVKVGDYVQMGATIGDMGNTGNSFGTHLHFEIWYGKPYDGGQSYNPLLFY